MQAPRPRARWPSSGRPTGSGRHEESGRLRSFGTEFDAIVDLGHWKLDIDTGDSHRLFQSRDFIKVPIPARITFVYLNVRLFLRYQQRSLQRFDLPVILSLFS